MLLPTVLILGSSESTASISLTSWLAGAALGHPVKLKSRQAIPPRSPALARRPRFRSTFVSWRNTEGTWGSLEDLISEPLSLPGGPFPNAFKISNT